MTRPGRYPQELRERAVRMVFEHQDEHSSQWGAITSIAERFGVSSETLRKWVRRAETDGGLRPGLTTDEREPEGPRAREPRAPSRERDLEVRGGFLRGGARPPTDEMIAYIDRNKDRFGVEPICRLLPIAPSTYHDAKHRPPSDRRIRDERLKIQIARVHGENFGVYGAARSGDSCTAKGSSSLAAPWSASCVSWGWKGSDGGRHGRPPHPMRPRLDRRIWSSETSRRPGPTSCGSRTSPTSPPGPASSTSRS